MCFCMKFMGTVGNANLFSNLCDICRKRIYISDNTTHKRGYVFCFFNETGRKREHVFLCFQLERANHRNDFKYDVFPFKTWKRDSVSKEIHCERGSVSTKHDKMVGNAHV